MVEQKNEPEQVKERFSAVEYVTQTEIGIKDNETGKVYTDMKELILMLVNKLNSDVVKI